MKKIGILIAAIITSVIILVVDLCFFKGTPETDMQPDIESYLRGMIEDSALMVNGTLYRGVYSSEEITEIPAEYTLLGTVTKTESEAPLTEDFTSNLLNVGVEVYGTASDASKLYIKSSNEDETARYIEYVIKE